jgi:hypothetical protein
VLLLERRIDRCHEKRDDEKCDARDDAMKNKSRVKKSPAKSGTVFVFRVYSMLMLQ